jgi:hypothetical protein
MKTNIKTKAIQKLRSGHYKQTTTTLCNGSGYCVMGVIARAARINKRDVIDRGELDTHELQQIGLSEAQQQRLIDLNDSNRWSFRRLASHIERYY